MNKILVHFDAPNMKADTYDKIWDDLRSAGYSQPKGLVHHYGAPNGEGWWVTDVWESAESFQEFGKTLMPILEKHGYAHLQPRIMPLHYEVAGA